MTDRAAVDTMPTRDNARRLAERWLDEYRVLLCAGDSAGISKLFAPEGVCVPSPLDAPIVGRDAIEAFYSAVLADVEVLDLAWDAPLVDAGFASAEWWGTLRENGKDVSEPGSLHFRLDESGLCLSWRAYPLVGERLQPVPDGWPREIGRTDRA